MVIVIGGGATGLGIAWDLVLRHIPVTLIEAHEPGAGTSGRFHGLLHSGARYVVTDPLSARQCREENKILRRIAPQAIEAVGGLFVSVDDSGEDFTQDWLKGTEQAGIPAVEVARSVVLKENPGLNSAFRHAYAVPDAVLEGFKLLQLLRDNIERRGGTIVTHSEVTSVHESNGKITAVTIACDGYKRTIPCDAVINAAGPWAGKVAKLWGDVVEMHLSAGLMLIYANRMVSRVISRMGRPGDGDIFVPHGRTVILGTTDVTQASAEAPLPTRTDAQYLVDLGKQLFPDIDGWRTLRAFTGVRPLFREDASVEYSRSVSRDFHVLNHGENAGMQGAFTVVGGKWTTFRLMAQRTVDAVAAFLGVTEPCRTDQTVLESRRTGASPLLSTGPMICECEDVGVTQLEDRIGQSVNRWRTETWFAMGPCQGTICAHRGISMRIPHSGVESALDDLKNLRLERERGVNAVAWGDTARELAFQEAFRNQTLAEESFRVIGR